MQTKTVYPIGRSPNKKWYSVVYGGRKRKEVNLSYKERTFEGIIISVVNFNKERLKEAMLKVLKERGQCPKDWNFEEWFNRFISPAKHSDNGLKKPLEEISMKLSR